MANATSAAEMPTQLVQQGGGQLPIELREETVDDPMPGEGVPAWARPYVPADFRIPEGRQVTFVRFRSRLTDAPQVGVLTDYKVPNPKNPDEFTIEKGVLSRVLVLWTLSDAEERQALKRTGGDGSGALSEQTKQMIRLADGLPIDWVAEWAKRPHELVNPAQLWTQLGSKCRKRLQSIYLKMHNMDDQEMADFLLNCVGSASAVAG